MNINENSTYQQLTDAIKRTHEHYLAVSEEDPVKENLRFQYQALLEQEEKYFGFTPPPEPEEEPKRKKRRKKKLSQEQRDAIRDRLAAGKAAKRAAAE